MKIKMLKTFRRYLEGEAYDVDEKLANKLIANEKAEPDEIRAKKTKK